MHTLYDVIRNKYRKITCLLHYYLLYNIQKQLWVYLSIIQRLVYTSNVHAWLVCSLYVRSRFTHICKNTSYVQYYYYYEKTYYVVVFVSLCSRVSQPNHIRGHFFKKIQERMDVNDFRHPVYSSFWVWISVHKYYAHWTGIHSYLLWNVIIFQNFVFDMKLFKGSACFRRYTFNKCNVENFSIELLLQALVFKVLMEHSSRCCVSFKIYIILIV